MTLKMKQGGLYKLHLLQTVGLGDDLSNSEIKLRFSVIFGCTECQEDC